MEYLQIEQRFYIHIEDINIIFHLSNKFCSEFSWDKFQEILNESKPVHNLIFFNISYGIISFKIDASYIKKKRKKKKKSKGLA